MPTGDGGRADPTEQAIEAALQPGRFISDGTAWSFIEGLVRSAVPRPIGRGPIEAKEERQIERGRLQLVARAHVDA
jgi:hypothetical protein